MRLREPFSGYKLSSGHFMFHMAYLCGSYFATHYVLDYETVSNTKDDSYNIMTQLNIAHALVPIFNFLSIICDKYELNVIEKSFDIIGIFQY